MLQVYLHGNGYRNQIAQLVSCWFHLFLNCVHCYRKVWMNSPVWAVCSAGFCFWFWTFIFVYLLKVQTWWNWTYSTDIGDSDIIVFSQLLVQGCQCLSMRSSREHATSSISTDTNKPSKGSLVQRLVAFFRLEDPLQHVFDVCMLRILTTSYKQTCVESWIHCCRNIGSALFLIGVNHPCMFVEVILHAVLNFIADLPSFDFRIFVNRLKRSYGFCVSIAIRSWPPKQSRWNYFHRHNGNCCIDGESRLAKLMFLVV